MKDSIDQDFEKIVREGLKPAAVPPHLRERVLNALAVEETKQRKSRNRFQMTRHWPIAAGLIITLAIGTVAGRILFRTSAHPWTEDLIADYVEMSADLEPEQIVTSSAREVEGWFHGKLPFAFSVPRLNGAELLGARLCKLKTGPAGLIFYEVNSGKVSLFVLNGQKIRVNGLERLSEAESPDLRGTASRGINLVSWERNGLVYALVSQLDRSELLNTLSNF